MNEIWIEKYRPRSLKDVVGQKDIVDRLQSYVEAKNLPHLMFAGPAGTGKTTCAIAMSREMYGDMWKSNFNELNASDERGIDVVRGKIKRVPPRWEAPRSRSSSWMRRTLSPGTPRPR